MEKINKKIIDIKYKMIRKEQLKQHEKELIEKINSEKETLIRLKRELEKEEADVTRLEKISIGALLQSINGGKGLRLEKEKADAARAALDYKQQQSDVEYMELQYNLLHAQLKDYESLEIDLEEYIDLKKKMIPGAIRERIKTMENELLQLQVKNKEIKEAQVEGERSLASLNAITDHMNAYLEDSSDPLFTYPDHEELTDLVKEISIFKGHWESFKKELKDVGNPFEQQIDDTLMDSISKYVYIQEEERDVIIDGVKESYQHLITLYGNIKAILQILEQEFDTSSYRIHELNIDIQKEIEEN